MAVPPSCRWLEPKARMDDACRVYNDRSKEWAALRNKSVPAVWQEASTSWQSMVQPLMALMGRDRFNAPGCRRSCGSCATSAAGARPCPVAEFSPWWLLGDHSAITSTAGSAC